MAVPGKMAPTTEPITRKSRGKSRAGCGNCKMRRTKCDETRPLCRKCRSSGYACDFSQSGEALQSTYENVAARKALSRYQCFTSDAILSNMNGVISSVSVESQDVPTYLLKFQDLQVLFRYQTRTLGSSTPENVAKAVSGEAMRMMSEVLVPSVSAATSRMLTPLDRIPVFSMRS